MLAALQEEVSKMKVRKTSLEDQVTALRATNFILEAFKKEQKIKGRKRENERTNTEYNESKISGKIFKVIREEQ